MKELGIFVTGFAVGWASRSTVDSLRTVLVAAVASGHGLFDSSRRLVAFEREYFEDLLAEARAVYESRKRAHAVAEAQTASGAGAGAAVEDEAPSRSRIRAV